LASIVVSAALPAQYLEYPGRWIIVATTVLTAAASEMLGQLKVREYEDLRERGRIEAARIASYARQKLPELVDDPAKISALKSEVRGMIHNLERNQHSGYVEIDGLKSSQPQ
jgi:hypothetical protein